jgi:very-short-patch-repair endonuclease
VGAAAEDEAENAQACADFRRNMTDAETILWSKLQDGQLRGHRFLKQHPIGPYFADFACRRHKLVVELDGETHSSPEEKAHDTRRTAFLERQGWK